MVAIDVKLRVRMQTSYLFIAMLAVVAPWAGTYLEFMLNIPYGFLVLILFASLSIAVSLSPEFSKLLEDPFFAEWSAISD
jgi:hypothetical protein